MQDASERNPTSPQDQQSPASPQLSSALSSRKTGIGDEHTDSVREAELNKAQVSEHPLSNSQVSADRQDNDSQPTASSSRLKPQPRARYSLEHRILLQLLIEARKASGLSQKALSQRLGKSLSHISFIEANDRDLTFVEVARICEIVDLPLPELVARFTQELSLARQSISQASSTKSPASNQL